MASGLVSVSAYPRRIARCSLAGAGHPSCSLAGTLSGGRSPRRSGSVHPTNPGGLLGKAAFGTVNSRSGSGASIHGRTVSVSSSTRDYLRQSSAVLRARVIVLRNLASDARASGGSLPPPPPPPPPLMCGGWWWW